MIDANAWAGTWPFGVSPAFPLLIVVSRLREAGFTGAVVSPLDAVFAPSPDVANIALFDTIAAQETFDLRLAPVIDPTQTRWMRHLADPGAGNLLAAVRLLPGYHAWTLDHPMADRVATLGLPVIVQVRMLDERAHHPMVKVPPVPVADLLAFARRHPETIIVASGILWSETAAVAEVPNIMVELSSIESDDTLPNLLERMPVARILLGSHAPIYDPLPSTAKLAGVDSDTRHAVATANARRLFGFDKRS